MCLYRILCVPSTVSGHWRCSSLLAVVSAAPANVGVQVSLWDPTLSSFGRAHLLYILINTYSSLAICLCVCFYIVAILRSLRGHLILVLVCFRISLMINGIEHLFTFFSLICVSSLEESNL